MLCISSASLEAELKLLFGYRKCLIIFYFILFFSSIVEPAAGEWTWQRGQRGSISWRHARGWHGWQHGVAGTWGGARGATRFAERQ